MRKVVQKERRMHWFRVQAQSGVQCVADEHAAAAGDGAALIRASAFLRPRFLTDSCFAARCSLIFAQRFCRLFKQGTDYTDTGTKQDKIWSLYKRHTFC